MTGANIKRLLIGGKAESVTAEAGSVYQFEIINPNSYPVFVKFFDLPVAQVGADTVPELTYLVKPADSLEKSDSLVRQAKFEKAVTIMVTKSMLKNDGAAPDPCLIHLQFT